MVAGFHNFLVWSNRWIDSGETDAALAVFSEFELALCAVVGRTVSVASLGVIPILRAEKQLVVATLGG